ncbi:MAG: dipeptidase [Rudaea sp.]|uniref:dipeptidase n=1 Tax=unclassified Rudaea TaxID=2627037 RepID=UPI0010F4B1E8|nr:MULTISPECIES: dipeptidase [unclassified Rudaea]MBN8887697.1 dipeptidase [Rudaea sp.]
MNNTLRSTIQYAFAACAAVAACAPLAAAETDAALAARVERVLAATPLIDGHNDLPWGIRERFGNADGVDLRADTLKLPRPADASEDWMPLMTDIPRLRKGHVGGQFWSVWIPSSLTGAAAVQTTLEQIDIVHNMVSRYPADMEMAGTADDLLHARKAGRVGALIGIEGGHQIGNSLPALRQMYALGVRYMTLTHSQNNDWADSATDTPKHHGLTAFGRAVVGEMNRLGMLVDLSHVSPETMKAALAVSTAPVMFSHSSARALVDHPRDVPDDVLALVKKNRGIVMVNFAPPYVSAERARWEADRAAEQTRNNAPPFAGLYIGQPDRAKAALAEWDKAHPLPPVTIAMVADHIEHIRDVCGIDCVGIGSDFDGIPSTPQGLDGVDKYPVLFVELARRGWNDADLAKLAAGNILRVLHEAEAAAKRLQATARPSSATIETLDAAPKKSS